MRFAGFLLLGCLLCPIHAVGKIKKDTIYTTDGDRIILTYDIVNTTNQATIKFIGQQKKLGRLNSKYKDLSKVAVLFFDRTGNYSGDVSFSNMVPEAFITPSEVQFKKSSDGYYLIQAEPKLSFTVKANARVHIPIYLAYKTKKGKYELFSKSRDLVIPLGGGTGTNRSMPSTQTVQQTITSTAEIETDNTIAVKVLESINLAKELLAQADGLPFSDNLLDEISYLRQKRREITDNALVSEISEVMEQYESKKRLLEDKSTEEQKAQQQAEELKAQQEAQAIKAQNDSIANAQQIASEKEKKRNLWMIIGGIILAILAFIGNQIFQGIRNKKNQMRMMDMQQNIADKAEAEAKRQARNAIRTQQNRIEAGTKRKVSDAVRSKGNIKINGKSKKASI